MSRLTLMKAEQIARMILQGYGPSRAAELMGLTTDGLLRIRSMPEYKEIEETLECRFSKGSQRQGGVHVQIDSKALAQAIQEANRTHSAIERASRERTKPVDA